MSATIDEMSELVQWSKLVDAMRGRPTAQLSKTELSYRKNYIGKWGNNE